MLLPDPIERMFGWIEERGLHVDTANGRLGFLFPEVEMKAGWTDTGRPGGTDISFSAEGNVNLRYWFGKDAPAINNRLCAFAHTGRDGSMAALWLDDGG